MGYKNSAGVYTSELDLSARVVGSSSTTGAIVGAAERGKINERVLVTNTTDYVSKFGKPNINYSYLGYTALMFLETSNSLFVTRVVSSNSKHSWIKINKDGSTNPTTAPTDGLTVAQISSDLFNGDTETALIIRAENPGKWGNNLKIKIDEIDQVEKTFTLSIFETKEGVDSLVNSYPGVSRKTDLISGYNKSQFIEDVINEDSLEIVVLSNPNIDQEELPSSVSLASLVFGNDGSQVSESDVVAGWSLYDNRDEVEIDLLLNAGYVSSTTFGVQSKMKSLAENRDDCFPILDMPESELKMSPTTDAIDWRNGVQNFNSSFSSLYGPWFKIADNLNGGKQLSIPASGAVGQIIVNRDNVKEPWYPPMGVNDTVVKSSVFTILGLTHNYNEGQRALLDKNGINYFLNDPGFGIYPNSQKTQQKKASALDRINVRRLLLVIKRAMRIALKPVIGELNNTFTRTQVFNTLDPFMQDIKSRNGVYSYQIIVDETNNTPTSIDNYEFNITLRVQPQKGAEFINLQIVIDRTGVSVNNV